MFVFLFFHSLPFLSFFYISTRHLRPLPLFRINSHPTHNEEVYRKEQHVRIPQVPFFKWTGLGRRSCDRLHATEDYIGRRLVRIPSCGKKEGKEIKNQTKKNICVSLGPCPRNRQYKDKVSRGNKRGKQNKEDNGPPIFFSMPLPFPLKKGWLLPVIALRYNLYEDLERDGVMRPTTAEGHPQRRLLGGPRATKALLQFLANMWQLRALMLP